MPPLCCVEVVGKRGGREQLHILAQRGKKRSKDEKKTLSLDPSVKGHQQAGRDTLSAGGPDLAGNLHKDAIT